MKEEISKKSVKSVQSVVDTNLNAISTLEFGFKSLSQITRIDTNDEEVAEMIPKTVWCIQNP